MGLIKVCEVSDIQPGDMLPIDVEGLPPLVIYNVDGDFYSTSNLCTHSIAMLSDGYLEGDIIECPLHGGRFNVKTGEATYFPCEEPLETFALEIREGTVFVQV